MKLDVINLSAVWRRDVSCTNKQSASSGIPLVKWRLSGFKLFLYPLLHDLDKLDKSRHIILKEKLPQAYADWVNGGWFYKPNGISLGKFG